MLGVFLKKNFIMLEYIDYKEVFLKLFFSYRTFLYAFLIYYLIKNRSDWKRMSYQLFAVNIFLSIISLVVNIYPLNLKGLEFFYFFGYASGIYFFYGLVAYFLETDKAPRYYMNIWVLLLVSVFSLGALCTYLDNEKIQTIQYQHQILLDSIGIFISIPPAL